jgi:hypothetical protein
LQKNQWKYQPSEKIRHNLAPQHQVLKICIKGEKKYNTNNYSYKIFVIRNWFILHYFYMTRILTSSDFASTIASGVTLVDMYADWCGPCQAIAPVIEELAHEYEGKANITKLDVDASGDIAQQLRRHEHPDNPYLQRWSARG